MADEEHVKAALISKTIELTELFSKPAEELLNETTAHCISSNLTDVTNTALKTSAGHKYISQIILKYLQNIRNYGLGQYKEGTLMWVLQHCDEDIFLHVVQQMAVKMPHINNNLLFQHAALNMMGTWDFIKNIINCDGSSFIRRKLFNKMQLMKGDDFPPTHILEELLCKEPVLLEYALYSVMHDISVDVDNGSMKLENALQHPTICFLVTLSSCSVLLCRMMSGVLYKLALGASHSCNVSALIGHVFNSIVTSCKNRSEYFSKYSVLAFYLSIEPHVFPTEGGVTYGKQYVLRLLANSLLKDPEHIIPFLVYYKLWYKELLSYTTENKLYIFKTLPLRKSFFSLGLDNVC